MPMTFQREGVTYAASSVANACEITDLSAPESSAAAMSSGWSVKGWST